MARSGRRRVALFCALRGSLGVSLMGFGVVLSLARLGLLKRLTSLAWVLRIGRERPLAVRLRRAERR
jgi:hypothetical protein